MALESGWYSLWFADSYFPPVWFAPADESAVPQEELRPEFRYGGSGRFAGQAARARKTESDAEILRHAQAKWEAIEAADARDAQQQIVSTPTQQDSPGSIPPKPEQSPVPQIRTSAHSDDAVALEIERMAMTEILARDAKKRQRNAAALLLLVASMAV